MSFITRAAKAKEKGNKLFKEGRIAESVKHYAEAEKLDPSNPVYPSNLSAALFELGDYLACTDAIFRSWSNTPEPSLAVKLSARLSKALCQGIQSRTIDAAYVAESEHDIEALEALSTPVANENVELWSQWKILRSKLDNFPELSHVAKVRFSQMPFSKGTPDQTMEFYSIGTDDVISLVDGWEEDPDPVNLQNFVKENSNPLAFLFGGAGDGRHVFGTLIGLRRAQKKLKPPQIKAMKTIHLTVLDIHFATVARDLLICWLVNTLIENKLDATGYLEVQSALVYIYIGHVMPDYAHSRMMKGVNELISILSSKEIRLPAWLHVDTNAVSPVLRALKYWSTNRTVTASRFLENHGYLPAMERLRQMSGTPAFASMKTDPLTFQRQRAEEKLSRMTDSEMRQLGNVMGMERAPLHKLKEAISKDKDIFIEALVVAEIDKNRPWDLENEAAWYKWVKAFVPSPKMWHLHPGFDVFRAIKDEKVQEQKLTKDGTEKGYPNNVFDIFTIVQQLAAFNEEMSLDRPVDKNAPAFCHTVTFFDNLVTAVKELGESVQVEFICGDVNREMSKIRLHTDSRPDTFPKKFTRIWLSNVPDYTNGTLNTAIYIMPVLQDTSDAAVSSNVLWNTPVWKSDAELCYTWVNSSIHDSFPRSTPPYSYTLLLPKDLSRYLGIRTLNDKALQEALTLGASPLPRSLFQLASRETFREWLTRLFISMVYPGTFQRRPDLVKLPNTLTVFVALLIELKNVGYPSHWLSDILQSLIDGAVITDRVAYRDNVPVPVSDLHKKGQMHRLRTDPWVAELEAIVASSRDGLPFSLYFGSGLAARASDIGYYKASIQANMFYTNPMVRFPDNDAVLSLLFYKDFKGLHSRVSGFPGTFNWFLQELPDIIDGKTTPRAGTFHILTGPDTVDLQKGVVTWRISKAKMELMRREKWSMVVWRTDFLTDSELHSLEAAS
ncbi:hypothetical protein DXG01_003246 [Tephrocybe rancida]|nr:hypothetical protein DXG01_003246 [Tephrocybe rancida]